VNRIYRGHTDELPRDCRFSERKVYGNEQYGRASSRLWDNVSGECVRTYTEHKKNCAELRFFSDSLRFASACTDGILKLWSVNQQESLATVQSTGGLFLSVDVTRDGRLIAAGDNEGTIQLWVRCGLRMHSNNAHTRVGDIDVIRFSEDGAALICACKDRRLRVFDVQSGCCIRTYPQQERMLRMMETNETLTDVYTINGKEILHYRRPNYGFRAGWVMSRIVSSAERFKQEDGSRPYLCRRNARLKNKEVPRVSAAAGSGAFGTRRLRSDEVC
jgi:WD40 repeat protein